MDDGRLECLIGLRLMVFGRWGAPGSVGATYWCTTLNSWIWDQRDGVLQRRTELLGETTKANSVDSFGNEVEVNAGSASQN